MKKDEWKLAPYTPIKTENVYELNISNLKIHQLANINPMMDDKQFEALKNDIELKGQLEPIAIYRDLIVDGRNRTKALAQLGSETVLAIELPWNYSTEDIRSYVMSKEKRRHQTQSQLAIKALGMWKGALGMEKIFKTKQMASKAIGVSISSIDQAGWILKHDGEDKLIQLYKDGSIYCCNRTIGNLLTLYRELKDAKDKEAQEILKNSNNKIDVETDNTINAYVNLIIGSNSPDVSIEVAKRIYRKVKEKQE